MNQTSDVATTQTTTAMTMTPAVVVVVSCDNVAAPLSLTMWSSADTTDSRHVCDTVNVTVNGTTDSQTHKNHYSHHNYSVRSIICLYNVM